jgi:hypothetical protein
MNGWTWILVLGMAVAMSPAFAGHYVVEMGSKSNPNAHLFAYDEKFRESTQLENYMLNMSASKIFTDATRLSTNMYLTATKDRTEIVINADFIGIGMVGYVIKDPKTGDTREEMSRISHMFIGNFSMDEHIKVLRDQAFDTGCWGACPVPTGGYLGPV